MSKPPPPGAEADGGTLAPLALPALATLSGRTRAWLDLMLVDHGVLRLAYPNLHLFAPGFWRSAQPNPRDLAWMAARHGIRTVLCIRGGRSLPLLDLEREACRRLGLELIEVRLRGREAPKRQTVLELIGHLERIEYPALVHCKSGADRTQFVAALYLLVRDGRPVEAAMRQLNIRYGHLEQSRAGILDAFFEAYRVEGEAHGLAFGDWLQSTYDPERLSRNFKPQSLTSLFAERILRREY